MISRATAITNIDSLTTPQLVTLANAALLAAIEAAHNATPTPNIRALCASIRTLIGNGDDVDG